MDYNLRKLTYNILIKYPDLEWIECYDLLLRRCVIDNDTDLAKKVFADVIAATTREKNTWLVEECLIPNHVLFPFLERYQLLELTRRMIQELDLTIQSQNGLKEYRDEYLEQGLEFDKSFMAQFRNRRGLFCICCHKYVLTCQELENFPHHHNEEYIRTTFSKALTEPHINKRTFITEYMVSKLIERDYPLDLILDLWFQAECHGSNLDISLRFTDSFLADLLTNQDHLRQLIRILSFRDSSHDRLIRRIVRIHLRKGFYSRALYFSSKIASPYKRLFYAIQDSLNNKSNEEKETWFLERVYRSLRHEKVRLSDLIKL